MIILDAMEYATDAALRAVWRAGYPKLLLEFLGSGNSFSDSSGEAHALTPYGNATQSGGYGVFDGNGDYVKTDSHADFGIGTGDFTAEFIIKCPVSQNAVSNLMANGSWKSNRFSFCSNHSSATANKVSFWLYNYNSGAAPMLVSTTSVNTNTDICICLEKYGNNYNLYVAGSKEATASYTGSMDGGGSQILYIGGNGSNEWFLGSIKQFRFCKLALYRGANYTPETNFYCLGSATESTIKEEGSYSMKVVAAQTVSLNKTIVRTVSPTINLTGQTELKFKIRASRTGSNFKIGFHDSGGTTTEVTPNIASADTWQEVTLDISAVTDANKDALDSIILTITNADAENTIYLDYMRALSLDEGTGTGGGVSKSRIIGGV